MHTGPSALEKRVDRVEAKVDSHVTDDESQFEALRRDIRSAVTDLGNRIDALGRNLQGQIDGITLDKKFAEGKAAGLAEARKPNPWTIAIAPAIVGAVIAAMLTWIGFDASHPRTTTVQTTTTATMPGRAP